MLSAFEFRLDTRIRRAAITHKIKKMVISRQKLSLFYDIRKKCAFVGICKLKVGSYTNTAHNNV